jgi:HEAT repeat protein
MRSYAFALRTVLACLLASCTGPAGGRAPTAPPRAPGAAHGAAGVPRGVTPGEARGVALGDARRIEVSALTREDREAIGRAWEQFRASSPLWPVSLKAIVARGGAGPYLLAENLFQHFFTASYYNKGAEIVRVAQAAALVGEPAAAYFAKPLVEDLVPLGREVVADVPDPDDPEKRIKRTFRHFQIDDLTRRHAAAVLAVIGPPAVPTLASAAVLEAGTPSGRRYAAMALGRIGTDEAVAALAALYDRADDWQDRAAAVEGLGAALPANPGARPVLERAARDADAFVAKKADEGLAGLTRLPF